MLIELFRSLSRLRLYEPILVEIALFERVWVTLNANFTGKGASPTNNFWHQKTRVPGLSYGEKKLRKIATTRVGCTNVTDRQTTDGRAMAYSERERKFTSTKNPYVLISPMVTSAI